MESIKKIRFIKNQHKSRAIKPSSKHKWAENEKWKKINRVAKFRSSRAQFETAEEFDQEIVDQYDQGTIEIEEIFARWYARRMADWW